MRNHKTEVHIQSFVKKAGKLAGGFVVLVFDRLDFLSASVSIPHPFQPLTQPYEELDGEVECTSRISHR